MPTRNRNRSRRRAPVAAVQEPTPAPAASVAPVPTSAPTQKLCYSVQETADLLGINYFTVHRLIKRGLLRASNALRHKLIPHTEIERFLQATLQ